MIKDHKNIKIKHVTFKTVSAKVLWEKLVSKDKLLLKNLSTHAVYNNSVYAILHELLRVLYFFTGVKGIISYSKSCIQQGQFSSELHFDRHQSVNHHYKLCSCLVQID